ncbi:MAG: polysaccharide deacetylase family protein [Chloroflexota bacterium]|nr:polysaccharide deacetylase family protein [Chloroflexota bacterium]
MTRTRAANVNAALFLVLLAVGGNAATVEAASATARVVSHGSRAVPTIALTFDDGSSPQNCRRILAELVAQGVPATFFPMAAALHLDPAFWRLVAKAGYPIGDHTVTHPHMPRLGYAAQLRQLTRSRALVESMLGRPMLDVFRPPYGEYNRTTQAAAAAAGFATLLLWDIDPRDWSRKDTMDQKLAAAEQGMNGSVVLLHCGPNATPYLVRDLIAFYRRHGFQFVTVPTLLGLAWDPGPTESVSPNEILGGLPPLPPSPLGGSIVDINGKYPPDPSGPPPGLPSATPSASPSVTASPSSPPGTRSDEPRGSVLSPTASPFIGSGGAEAPAPFGVALAAIGLAILALLLLTVAALRGRR